MKIVVILLVLLILYLAMIIYNKKNLENYQSYTDCLNQGYPNKFCINTPTQSVISDNYCYCTNGVLGTLNNKNKCTCYPFNPILPYYSEKIFTDYLS
tara:strand:- start:13229 stop:13519 length:291 start_codon:yes stop_codon:yes gene_type:complete